MGIKYKIVLSGLERELENLMQDEGVERKQMRYYRYLDIRYVGQEYFVSVPMPQDTIPDAQYAERFKQDFHELYQQTYGHSNPEERVELANIRVEARGEIAAQQEQQPELVADPDRMQSSRVRPVYFDGRAPGHGIHTQDGIKSGRIPPGASGNCGEVVHDGCAAWIYCTN